jgi:NADPH:quinone reductase-like Zn-dependent oxidoreductase
MGSFLASTNTADLLVLRRLIEAGRLKPVLDRTFPLAASAEAIRYLEEGRARGKVVITIDGADRG